MFDELKAAEFKYENERSVAFTICENGFLARAPPRPRQVAHDAPSDPLVGWGGDTPKWIAPKYFL